MKKKKDFRILKTTLKSVLAKQNNQLNVLKINHVVDSVSRLKTHLLQFNKLHFIWLSDNKLPLPEINRSYIFLLFNYFKHIDLTK
jgi:hypothetical protein